MSKRSKTSHPHTIRPPHHARPLHSYHRHLLDTLEPRMLLTTLVGGETFEVYSPDSSAVVVASLDESTPLAATESDEIAALRQAYIDYAVQQYRNQFGKDLPQGPHFYPYNNLIAQVMADVSPVFSGTTAVTLSSSDIINGGTNTQQLGIDEADLIKTDGRYIYAITQRQINRYTSVFDLTIVDTAVPDDLRVVSRTELGRGAVGLYLHDGKAVVLSNGIYSKPNTSVRVFDVSDPGNVALVEHTSVEGSLITSRFADGKLTLITSHYMNPPALKTIAKQTATGPVTVMPIQPILREPATGELSVATDDIFVSYCWNNHSEPTKRYETEAEYRARLEAMPIEDLLPSVTTLDATQENAVGLRTLLADPADILLNDDGTFGSTMTGVVVIDLNDDQVGVTDALLISGIAAQNVYVSDNAIYLAQNRSTTTIIRKIVTDNNGQVTLAATGEVAGRLVNDFSMDEHNGNLRIATTTGNTWRWSRRGPLENHLFVLEQVGDELVTIGQIDDIAPNERIYSVRFDGDRAVMTTGTERIDPIFTLDLSDPTAPTISGELVTPAFSTYMHQVGDDLFLGIGDNRAEQDWGGGWWRSRGRGDVRLSLVDVSDFDEPRESDTYVIEDESRYGRSYSEAQWDHHAFQYYDDLGLAILPATARDNDPDTVDNADLYLFDIDAQTGITSVAVIDHQDGIRRSIRIGDTVFAISSETITAHAVGDLGVTLGEVDLINAEILAPHEIAEFDIVQGIAYLNTSAVASTTNSLFSLLSSQTEDDPDTIDATPSVMANGSLDLGL